MINDFTAQLVAALQRDATDPLVAQVAALLAGIESGRLTIAGVESRFASDTNLQPIRNLVSFQGAEITGNITIGDVAGGHIIKIAINLPPPLPPRDLAAAQTQLATLPLDTVSEPTALPPGSRMPFARNPLFTGRKHDLKQLATVLKGGSSVVAIAATGIGGMGKTQLAAEFAHRYGQYFGGGVFWLSFADSANVPAEVVQCGGAGAMNLPAFDALKLDDQVARVRQEWQSPLPRLLIFDNCEDEALLDTWRPKTGGCRVLVTSRRAHWDTSLGVQIRALGIFSRVESVALLRKFRSDLPTDDPELDAIAAELGDLPLAIHLAGSFLTRYQYAITPAAYLAQLHDPALLQHRSLRGMGFSPTGHELDVARTFALSYERLDSADPIDDLAIKLLARAACLAPGEPVPHGLLVVTLAVPADEPDRLLQVEDALGRLVNLGLLETEATDALRLHRLLAVFVRNVAADPDAQAAVEQTMVVAAYNMNSRGYPAALLSIQPHLRTVTNTAMQRNDARAAVLCNNLCYHLKMVADYVAARPFCERALQIDEQVFGPTQPATASSLNNLALVLHAQGDYTAAQSLYERALAIREQVLGPTHPDTAQSLDNLAGLLDMRGDYTAAQSLYERALAIREQALGPTHPDTATSLNNLAILHYAQNDYARARPLAERALAIHEQVLGPTHPDTATSLNSLATLFQAQGDYARALPLHERALAIRTKVLGPNHPDTASSLNNLALLLHSLGDYAAAQALYARALATNEQVLGPTHPDTATSLNNLAGLLKSRGDYMVARPLFERALAIYIDRLGTDHPTTRIARSNLDALDASL